MLHKRSRNPGRPATVRQAFSHQGGGRPMRIARRYWCPALVAGILGLALASASEAGQFNWQQFKGTQLRVMLNKHPWQLAIEPHLKEFEALTGMKLVVEVYPEDQFRAKTSVELQSGSGSMDVF